MQPAAKRRMTAREYLEVERLAETRSEFLDGEMFAMAGGTRKHSRIAVNLAGILNNRLAGKACQVFNSDMRLRIEATGLFTYPDVQVACGKLRFADAREDTLLNPRIVVEVLSDSTAAWDRGKKFWHYRHLASLAEYVLVSQDGWLIEHYTRQTDGGWRLATVDNVKGALTLKSVKVRVLLSEIYANTGLKPGVVPPDPVDSTPYKK